jgi:hypothetical protein
MIAHKYFCIFVAKKGTFMKLYIFALAAFASVSLPASELSDPIDYRYQYIRMIPTHSTRSLFEFKVMKCTARFDGVETCKSIKDSIENSCMNLSDSTELLKTYNMAYFDSFKLINATTKVFINSLLAAVGVEDPSVDWIQAEFKSSQGYRKKYRVLRNLTSMFSLTTKEKESIDIASYLTPKQLERYKKKGKLPKGKKRLVEELLQKKELLQETYVDKYLALSAIRLGVYKDPKVAVTDGQRPSHNVVVQYQKVGNEEFVSAESRPVSFGWVYPAGRAKPRTKKSGTSTWNARFYDNFLEVFNPITFNLKSADGQSRAVTFTPDTRCL